LPGNSLIGLLHVSATVYNQRVGQLNLFQKTFQEVVEEKDRLIRDYKNISQYVKDLRLLRDNIQAQRDDAFVNLNELLLDDFKRLDIKYEQTTWDESKNTEGRPIKRSVKS
jgi:hypothetical protein